MEHFIMVMLVTTLRKNASVRFPFSFYCKDKPENQGEGFLWRCERIKKLSQMSSATGSISDEYFLAPKRSETKSIAQKNSLGKIPK
jgi:hypothetical protein